MSVTSGFFDSLNHDRKYNTLQMSSIFDGIIQDGVFMSITDKLMVDAESGMTIIAKPGRAWFNHTWTLNDAKLPLEVDPSELILDRIDAVVLEVNASQTVRANTIKMVKGTPSSSPQKPELTKSVDVNQYPLSYVTVRHGVTEITQADIENTVGTSECPFVTGIIDTISIDDLLVQWTEEWKLWIDAMKQSGEDWQQQAQEEFTQWSDQFKATMDVFQTNSEESFNTWFAGIKDILDGDTAGKLLNEINELKDGEPNATATYENGVVSIISDPTTAKKIYFYAPSDFNESDTYTLNGIPITIKDLNNENIYDAWKNGSPVSLIIKGDVGFFKSGGGVSGTLPPMVTNLAAVAGNQQITVTYKNPVSDVLAGVLVVYKTGSYPTKPTDGIKVDAGLSESAVLEGLENGIDYYIRVYPYNSKKQYQTIIDGATTTARPSEGPQQVTDLQVSGSGAIPVLTWKNPTDDPTYYETVVIQKVDSAPTSLSDGTEIYRGTGETVSANGLKRLKNYYWGVFTVNAEGGTRGPVTTEVYSFDFPEEPTSFTQVQSYTSGSHTFILPETGWFLLCALGKSGNGANGSVLKLSSGSGIGGSVASGGSGGTGSFAEYLLSGLAGDKIEVYIDTNNSYISKIDPTYNTKNEIIKAGAGGNGREGAVSSSGDGTGGSGGAAGNATGIEGSYLQQGSAGTRGEGASYINGCTRRTNGVTSSYVSHYDNGLTFNTTSGYGGYACWSGSNGTVDHGGNGSNGSIIIYRGNTNQVFPSVASTLSLTPHNTSIEASWTNSEDPESVGTILVSNSDRIPTNPTDGTSVDVAEATTYTISDLPNDTPTYVSLFAYNADKTKYSAAKSDVEIPREVTWYDTQQELKQEVQQATEQAEQAQEAVTMTRDFLPDAIAFAMPQIYDEWDPNGIAYTGKDKATEENPAAIVRRNGELYRCLQSHTSQENWKPETSPSLWVEIADPALEWPEWKQPTDATNAYNEGDKVAYNGKHYISKINGNTTVPGSDDRWWEEVKE